MKNGSILFVRNAFGLGGAELYSYIVAKELKSLGYRLVLSSNLDSLRKKVALLRYPTYQPTWTGRFKGLSFRLLTILNLPILSVFYFYVIVRQGVRVVNVMSPHDLIALSFIKPLLGFRMIWTDHGDLKTFSKSKTRLMKDLLRWALSCCERIILVSDNEMGKVKETLVWSELEKKFIVVHNGVEIPEERRIEDHQIMTVGSTARVQREKGLDVLIEALPEVKKGVNKRFQILLAGTVDHQEIVDRVNELGLSSLVKFVGFQEDVDRFLRQLDIYVFPSRNEVFPLSTLEAMARGLPIIATNVGGIPEQIIDGKEGFLVDAGDEDSLAEKITELINNDSLREEMGRRAREKVSANFNIKDVAKRLIEIYDL